MIFSEHTFSYGHRKKLCDGQTQCVEHKPLIHTAKIKRVLKTTDVHTFPGRDTDVPDYKVLLRYSPSRNL